MTFVTKKDCKDYFNNLVKKSPDKVAINDYHLFALISYIPDHETYLYINRIGIDHVYAFKGCFFIKLLNKEDIPFDYNKCIDLRFNNLFDTL